ncbi:MAG: YtxH domain-containing protein [Elusimicrobiota bacterium]|jgi:gas vesicle protein
MSENNNSGECIFAFMLGGVVGAALGVLFAPASGAETRRRIGRMAEEGREKVREVYEKERELLHSKKEQVGAAFEAAQKAYRETGGSAA